MAWGIFFRHIQSSYNVNKYLLNPSSVTAWNQLPLFISDFHFSSISYFFLVYYKIYVCHS